MLKLTVSRSKEFFTSSTSIPSFPSLIAKPTILLLSDLLSAPIVIALVCIFFAEEIIESPVFPKLTVPSLQNDQLLAFNSEAFASLFKKTVLSYFQVLIKLDKDSKIVFENWNFNILISQITIISISS